MVDVVTVFDIFDILTLTGGTKYVKIGQRDWRGCRGLLNIVKELQRRCWEAKRDIVTLWHCDWHCGFLRVFKFGKGSVVRQKRDGQCEWLTLRVLEMLTHLKMSQRESRDCKWVSNIVQGLHRRWWEAKPVWVTDTMGSWDAHASKKAVV